MTRLGPLLALTLAAAACGDDSEASSQGGGGQGGSSTSATTGSTGTGLGTGGDPSAGGGGSAPVCDEPDPPGSTFTFTFHNDTPLEIGLPTGCGDVPYMRIYLGDLAMAVVHPEGADACQTLCDTVLEGQPPTACSDCGPGSSILIEPGGVATYEWDRRVYVTTTIVPACSGLPEDVSCAFGSTRDVGTSLFDIDVCSDTGGDTGMCSPDRIVSVSIDLSADGFDVLIEPL